MSIRLISDLHLDESRPAVARAFFHYLQHLPEDTESLYLLGDIFEIWIGDDDDAAFIAEIKDALKKVSDSGIKLYCLHGNRDFLIADTFCQQTGCELLQEPVIVEQNQSRFMLMHGDALCIDDVEYQAFKQNIRNPDSIAFLLSKPLEERRALAQSLREQTKSMSSNKAADIMDVNDAEVERVMQALNADTLIHGHTHRPNRHKVTASKERIVLGDWHDLGWEIILDNGDAELKAFIINEPS